jgi:hypothetical protein
MRQIEDYLKDTPKNLQPKNKKITEIAERVLSTKRIEKTDYNRAGVKNKLLKIYAYCCAFCEKRIGIADNIEHFRAKHEISILDSALKKQVIDNQGYYWLGFEWSNFLVACRVCNLEKGTFFPINGTRAQLPFVDFTDKKSVDAFFQKTHIGSEELMAEKPLLLHPILDNPNDYLTFEIDGTVTAKNNNIRGIASINIYGLSNEAKNIILIRDRQTIINNIRGKVEHAILNYVNDERLYQDLLNIHVLLQEKIMKEQDHIRQPFSAVRRACLERFKTFFIDIFEGEQAIRLNKAYNQLRIQLNELQM